MASELEVLLHDRLVGHIVEGEGRDWSFVYTDRAHAARATPPVALALPRRQQTHRGPHVRAVFTNLLPDGQIRHRLARSLGLSASNDFGLLARIAADCHGALSVRRPGIRPAATPARRLLSDAELRNAIAVLPVHPLLAEADGLSVTLAGEFDKLPVSVEDGRVFLLLGGGLTTHIIKPAKPGLKESVMNEGYTMQLAARFGLPVARSELLHGELTLLCVTRFDRTAAPSPATVHMEDICQVMGLPPDRKYQREGGPGTADLFALVRRLSIMPALDIRALIRWYIYSFLVGFGAAHGKQLALLYGENGPRLAPFFGLWSTHVYPEMNRRMGFAIGNEDRPDWLIATCWQAFAREIGVRPRFVFDELRAAAEALPHLALACADRFQRENGYAAIVRQIRALIEQCARQLLVSLEAETRAA